MKKYRRIFIALLLLGLSISLLPFPVRINRSYEGIYVSETENRSVTIIVEAWHLRYIFFDDALKGNVKIHSDDSDLCYEFTGPVFSEKDKDVSWSALMGYSVSENKYVGGYLFFDKEMDNIMIAKNEKPESDYIVPANDYREAENIRKYFME